MTDIENPVALPFTGRPLGAIISGPRYKRGHGIGWIFSRIGEVI